MVRTVTGRLPSETTPRTAVAERLRVLIVGDFSASKVGNASVAEQLAVKLKAAGDQVVTTSDRTNRVARVAGKVIDTARYRHAIDVAIIDVFAGMGFRWAEWTTQLLAAADVPMIHVLRSGSMPMFSAGQPGRVRRLFAASSSVVALSGFLKEEMSSYGTISEIIPNPIQVSKYPYRHRSIALPKLVWLRTFNQLYNPTLAPKVLAELVAQGSPSVMESLHLSMYGADQKDGTWEATLATARALGVDDILSMPGPALKADVPARLAEGDIFLNTTHVDNSPISVVEAMACGLCVVSTDVGGMRYIVTHGVDGLLVPDNDAPAMAAAVKRILENPDLADRLSSNARLKAESFDWDKILPRWREHIAKVIAGHARK